MTSISADVLSLVVMIGMKQAYWVPMISQISSLNSHSKITPLVDEAKTLNNAMITTIDLNNQMNIRKILKESKRSRELACLVGFDDI